PESNPDQDPRPAASAVLDAGSDVAPRSGCDRSPPPILKGVMAANRPRTRPPSILRRGLRMGLLGRRDPAGNAGRRVGFSEGGFGDLYTRKVLDLTIRLAEVMLSSGSGTADVVATARDVAQAYRIDDCVIDVTFTTITVSTLPSAETPPVTIVRSVHAR